MNIEAEEYATMFLSDEDRKIRDKSVAILERLCKKQEKQKENGAVDKAAPI